MSLAYDSNELNSQDDLTVTQVRPTSCRVAIVDERPAIHKRLFEMIGRNDNARGFLTVDSLIQRVGNEPLVILVGPTALNTGTMKRLAWIIRNREHTAVVLAVRKPSQQLMQWATVVGIHDMIDLDSEAGQLGDAVNAAGNALTEQNVANRQQEALEAFFPTPQQRSERRSFDSPEHQTNEQPIIRAQSSAEQGRANVVSVFSTKGGTGKSVVASNLAVQFASTSKRPVVLVDADFQFGDLAVMLKMRPEHTISDAVEMIDKLDSTMLQQMLVRHPESGVYLLASPSVPVVGDFITAQNMTRILELLGEFAGHVVIDTQSHIDEATIAILDHSSELVLVGSMDIPAIKDMKTALHVLRSVGIQIDNAKLVMNRAGSKEDFDLNQIERLLHRRVDRVITNDAAIPRSINNRQPLMLDLPNSNFGKSVQALADSLRKKKQ